ncbi:MAG: hypothetical protein QXU52_03440 [Fervidicoccaceae archaeon]
MPFIAGAGEIRARKAREEFLRFARRESIDFPDYDVVEVEAPELFEDLFPWPDPPLAVFDGVRVPMELPERLWITDTTFRDGQQARKPFTVEQITRLYEFLHAIGGPRGKILFTEFFTYTSRDREALRRVRELGYEYPMVTGWIRASLEELRRLAELGLSETGMLASISDYHIFLKLREAGRRRAIEKYLTVLEEGLKRGITMRVHLEDCTRANIFEVVVPFVRRVLRLSEKYGVAVRVRVPDTLGVGLPWPEASLPRSVPKIMWVLRHVCGVPSENLEFHGHNDFYLGVANAVAAWLYGAALNNTTLLGIGERAGNVPLEAMVFAHASLKGSFDGMNPRVLREVAEYFERELGHRVPDLQPLLGRNFFVTRAGIHIDGTLKDVRIYLPFDTKLLLGVEPGVEITPYSGAAGVAFWINNFFKLDGSKKVSKDHPAVQRIHAELVSYFEGSGALSAPESLMLELVRRHMPELLVERQEDLGMHRSRSSAEA